MAKVALVKCNNYNRTDVLRAVSRAYELLGGSSLLKLKNKSVVLKPNLLLASKREKRITTDPEIIRALAEIISKENPSTISLGDSPGFSSAKRVMQVAGYNDILKEAPLKQMEFTNPTPVKAKRINHLTLAEVVTKTDCLINVAKFKTHGMMGMTLATKNLFGCVVGNHKPGWHFKAGENYPVFADIIIEVAMAADAKLHVLDGVIGMEGNGPTAGTPREFGYILVSTDSIALDRVACHLTGVDISTVPTFAAAARYEFGEQDLSKIEILGDDPEQLRITNLKPACKADITQILPLPKFIRKIMRKLFTAKPVFANKLCKKCDACIEICPADCLVRKKRNVPEIDRKKCIRCFCCQEACTFRAISVRSTFISRLFG